ncbi:FxsA family protein [Methylobacillus flagellatus]|uniref:FxsA family protein n=1 Tax=Methylobacillus flagellatus TaxID=405 RepID=UPI000045F686|nr:FxsA family protein [Methylobacillus flagellatus]
MRFLFLLLILLAFPIAEVWVLVELAARYGWLVLAYLILVGMLGWRLIQDEKLMMMGRMVQTLQAGGTPLRAIFGSAKNMLAGMLLIMPGVISDAIAVVLLLLPGGSKLHEAANDDIVSRETSSQSQRQETHRPPGRGDVIEGEYRRED